MKKLIISLTLFLSACANQDVLYKPADQILPHYIKSIAIRNFSNRTQQFGLEERLTLKVIDEFLKNGQYKIVPENQSDGVVIGSINHYILMPIQYDSNMVTTVYKLTVIISVKFLDIKTNTYLWEEPAMEATRIYSASTLPGGLTEEQARDLLWNILAKDIVKRTVLGFGSASSISQKRVPTSTMTITTDDANQILNNDISK